MILNRPNKIDFNKKFIKLTFILNVLDHVDKGLKGIG